MHRYSSVSSAELLSLRTCWGPSPCSRLSRPRTTTAPPPPPNGISWRRAFPPLRQRRIRTGLLGGFPRSLFHRSSGEVPNYAPAASPRLRRRLSPWPPCRRHRPTQEFPTHCLRVGARRHPAHIRQIRAGGPLEGRLTLVSSVHLPVSLAEPRPSDGAGLSRLCQGCLPPSPASPGVGLPSESVRYVGLAAVPFHHRTVNQRLVALDIPGPDTVWLGGHQPRRLPMRMPSLWATLGHLVGVVQHPIHRCGSNTDTAPPPARWRTPPPVLGPRTDLRGACPTPACVPAAPTHTAMVDATNALSARAIFGADKPRHELHPTPGMLEPGQRWERAFPRPLSFVVGGRRRVQGDPQQLGGFFCIERIVSVCLSRCRRRAISLRSCSFPPSPDRDHGPSGPVA